MYCSILAVVINTHYYNSNFIWRTVSRRVDEAIPSAYLRDNPIVWPNPRDMIQYARSSYYNNLFIIYLYLTSFWFYNLFWSLIPKNCGNVCHNVMFLDVTSSCFPSLVPFLKVTLRNVATKTQENRIMARVYVRSITRSTLYQKAPFC